MRSMLFRRLRPALIHTLILSVTVFLNAGTLHAQTNDGDRTSSRCIGSPGYKCGASDTAVPLAPTLILMPHCTESDRSRCATYETADATHTHTSVLSIGDIVDLDVAISGSNLRNTIGIVRAWLQYDPSVLEARSIDLTDMISQPLPGEQAVDSKLGIVKIGGGLKDATAVNNSATTIAIARVSFRILAAKNTSITFLPYKNDATGQASIVAAGTGGPQKEMLAAQPSILTIRINGPELPNEIQSSAGSDTGANQTNPAVNHVSAFTLLQIQGVQLTSRDANIFLGWQPLRSSELVGYNVYYGTVSGRYIQRRSVSADAPSLVIRDLDPGTQYFLSVRGFNATGAETAFSNEVAVVVGRPETATAPLGDDSITQHSSTVMPRSQTTPASYRGSVVQGETGLSTTIGLLLLASAAIGTIAASRRQFHLMHSIRDIA